MLGDCLSAFPLTFEATSFYDLVPRDLCHQLLFGVVRFTGPILVRGDLFFRMSLRFIHRRSLSD
jgi:hypothetical protein